jgi:Cu+-exporting ATPase
MRFEEDAPSYGEENEFWEPAITSSSTDVAQTEESQGTSARACVHCGEDCGNESQTITNEHGDPFCCSGCKTVYELLNENQLYSYYEIEPMPGNTLREAGGSDQTFAYLDDEDVINRLLDFTDGERAIVTFYTPGMHCASCIWLLEHLHKLDAGVMNANVTFPRREVSITYRPAETSLRNIAELLTSIGYEPEIKLDQLDRQKQDHPNRKLWTQLGVAGFAFGNIMLFSFPDYLTGLPLENNFQYVFGYLSLFLALPVLFYSGSDYFRSAWAAIKQAGVNLDVPIVIGMLALFGRSAYEIITGIGAGYMDSFSGLVFFLLIGKMVQKKTFERLSFDRDYRSYFPISISRLDGDGIETVVMVEQLKPGDTVRVRNQELIPADSILKSKQAHIDYSFVTGESDPVAVSEGDTIYAGGRLVGPSATLETVKEVSNSYLTRLWNQQSDEETAAKPKMSTIADRLAAPFTLGVITIAIGSVAYWWPSGWQNAFSIATAVLIVACPCALALSAPFTFSSAMRMLARDGFYAKGTTALERLSKIQSVVFDKTGTLTETQSADVEYAGIPLDQDERHWLSAALHESIHPLSRKVAAFLDQPVSIDLQLYEEQLGKGIIAELEGHVIRLGSRQFLQEDNSIIGLEPPAITNGSQVYVAIDGHFRGIFTVRSRYRSGLKRLISHLKESFQLFLLSGDNDSVRERFSLWFDADDMHFSQSPDDKRRFITQLQKDGQRVLMIGDGLNDAHALRQSDFGVALTDDIGAFSPSCDAIMEARSLYRLPEYVQYAQDGLKTIKASFALSILYNTVGLGFAITGHLSPLVAAILMPLSSITIMLFTTGVMHWRAHNYGMRLWK